MLPRRRVLVVDPICRKGHVSFNVNYIRYLSEQNCDVSFAGEEEYLPPQDRKLCRAVHSFAPVPFTRRNKLTTRITAFANLLQIQKVARASDNCCVLFTDFEELTLCASGAFTERTFCVCHGTVEHLRNPLKRACARRIFRTATAIAFTPNARLALESQGLANVVVVSHGVPAPFKPRVENAIGAKIPLNGRKMILVPSLGEIDEEFFRALLRSETFLRFLTENKLLLVAKTGDFQCDSPSVLLLDTYLKRQDYEELFLLAELVFLPYSRSLEHRVSNVLFECFANNVLAVVLRNDALYQFREHFTYDPFVCSEAQLISTMSELLERKSRHGFRDLEKLRPVFDVLRSEERR